MENKNLQKFLNNSEFVPKTFLGSKGEVSVKIINKLRKIRNLYRLSRRILNLKFVKIDREKPPEIELEAQCQFLGRQIELFFIFWAIFRQKLRKSDQNIISSESSLGHRSDALKYLLLVGRLLKLRKILNSEFGEKLG